SSGSRTSLRGTRGRIDLGAAQPPRDVSRLVHPLLARSRTETNRSAQTPVSLSLGEDRFCTPGTSPRPTWQAATKGCKRKSLVLSPLAHPPSAPLLPPWGEENKGPAPPPGGLGTGDRPPPPRRPSPGANAGARELAGQRTASPAAQGG